MKFPIKCEGETIWIREGKSKQIGPTTAIIHGSHKIVVDAKFSKNGSVTHLKSNDGIMFVSDSDQSDWKGQAHGKLYSNENGYLLFGTWIEDGEEYLWVVELKNHEN